MATRVSAKLIQSHLRRHQHHRQFARILNAGPAQADGAAAYTLSEPVFRLDPTITRSEPEPVLELSDGQRLFANVPTTKLLKSTATLKMASVDPIVDVGLWVMKSKLVETPVAKDLILGATRRTFYEQFVAGEDLREMGRTVRKMADSGLRAMLVYGSEHAHDNPSCDKNYEAFMSTVEATKTLPSSAVSFVIIKISAIYPIALLERISDLLRWEHQHPSETTLHWKQPTLPLFSPTTPLYHTQKPPAPLTAAEERDLELGNARFRRLCERCAALGVPLTIDAEETTVQPAIDYLTYSAAIKFNAGGKPIVFGTIQAYLRDAKERLTLAMEAAEKMGVPMGFKLVRGAYMSYEGKLAGSLGFESPVHRTINDTHDCYNDCATYLTEKVAEGSGAVVLATHNVESGRLAATKARALGIGRENDRFQFAQLYGMSDSLSFGLINAGFQVSKYLTFGPVQEVMPYLLRRAEENRGMLSSSTIDRKLMWSELKRRITMQG